MYREENQHIIGQKFKDRDRLNRDEMTSSRMQGTLWMAQGAFFFEKNAGKKFPSRNW